MAAYEVSWPIVFARITRRVELRRGHRVCSLGMHRLADDCIDRFHDDVEAVVDDLLAHARKPIENLEAWIASRVNAATVDSHRRRRGSRGALQRPRVPTWLSQRLKGDRWLVALALEILTWVGTQTTAGTNTWPLDNWAERRGTTTGDWPSSNAERVADDVERVLAAMRDRSRWYAAYVEGPLGRKRTLVASFFGNPDGAPPSLQLVDHDEVDDGQLSELATAALDAITARLRAGEDPRSTVVDVISIVFGADTGAADLHRTPYQGNRHEERLPLVLDDPSTVDHIVRTVLDIIGNGAAADLQ